MRKVWVAALFGAALGAPVGAAESSASAERGWSLGGGVGPITPLPQVDLRVVSDAIRVGNQVTLEAKVYRPRNTPVVGVPVTFFWDGRNVGTATTGSDGYARISHVPNKTGLIRVKAEARSWGLLREDTLYVTVRR